MPRGKKNRSRNGSSCSTAGRQRTPNFKGGGGRSTNKTPNWSRSRSYKHRATALVAQPPRAHLRGVEVVDPKSILVNGLPSSLFGSTDAIISHFSKFGKIERVVADPIGIKPTRKGTKIGGLGLAGVRALITFQKANDATDALFETDTSVLGGSRMCATMHKSKFCPDYLKGKSCHRLDCVFMHDEAADLPVSENAPPSSTHSQQCSLSPETTALAPKGVPPKLQGRGPSTLSCWDAPTTNRRLFRSPSDGHGALISPKTVLAERQPAATGDAAAEEQGTGQPSASTLTKSEMPSFNIMTPDSSIVTNVLEEMNPTGASATRTLTSIDGSGVSKSLPNKQLFPGYGTAVGDEDDQSAGIITSPWDLKAPFMIMKEQGFGDSFKDDVQIQNGSFFSFSANSPKRRTRHSAHDGPGYSSWGNQKDPQQEHQHQHQQQLLQPPPPPSPSPQYCSQYNMQQLSVSCGPGYSYSTGSICGHGPLGNQAGWAPGTVDIGGLRIPLQNVPLLYTPYDQYRQRGAAYPAHYPLPTSPKADL